VKFASVTPVPQGATIFLGMTPPNASPQRKQGKRPDSLLALRAFLLPPRKLVAPVPHDAVEGEVFAM
jgi:hypothetical protein